MRKADFNSSLENQSKGCLKSRTKPCVEKSCSTTLQKIARKGKRSGDTEVIK